MILNPIATVVDRDGGVPSVAAEDFFASWKHICEAEKDLLIKLWHRRKEYTAKIFDHEESVVDQVADELGLKPYCGYYCIDAIFFEENGLVDCRPVGQTWVQRIRIAFEHEHSFCSGLYQEVSHLCITRADLRVLVTYPGRFCRRSVPPRGQHRAGPGRSDPRPSALAGGTRHAPRGGPVRGRGHRADRDRRDRPRPRRPAPGVPCLLIRASLRRS